MFKRAIFDIPLFNHLLLKMLSENGLSPHLRQAIQVNEMLNQAKESPVKFSRPAIVVFILLLTPFLRLPLAGAYQSSQSSGNQLPTPEQFFGFSIGADTKLARWDKIVEYFKLVDAASDRVNLRELGKTTLDNPFIALEISSANTIKNLDRYKQLERKLYFQGGAPTTAERDEIFKSGKAVVMVTCSIHATEIGASQMVLELVHRLATEDSPTVKKILDNTIFVLVPSLNPDGQIMVTDWYNKNLGTEYEASPLPYLYHHYIGHDNNRDMYMFTQKESQLTARLLWHDWFPSVWLDEHQQGSNGARIFVMPATDPINSNVHPLVYRWNGIFGQAQAAALEAEGKEGIIYNSTYTNFWQGAMAWSGWWHNQIGLLTEVASARIASPIEQRRAQPGQSQPASEDFQAQARRQMENPNEPLSAPRDVTPRTEYPRPWLGGHWTLRDIVDYELIATMALLETAADQRKTLLKQIYEINRATVEKGVQNEVSAILINQQKQHNPRAAEHLVEKLQLAGVEVMRAETEFEAEGKKYPAGSFVIPMNQVFARYAKDMLEKQTYPEVRRSPTSPPEPPYDVTAWSLGMQMGVETVFVKKPLPSSVRLNKLAESPAAMTTNADKKAILDYKGADDALTINRWLKSGTAVTIATTQRDGLLAASMGAADANLLSKTKPKTFITVQRAPRIGFYQPWTANMDEGWTRWVLEQYEFPYTTLHNAEIKAGKLRERFDVILLADQSPRDILEGNNFKSIRPEYRSGIGDEGLEALRVFVREGGTLITLGGACDLAIEKFPIPVRNLKKGLTRDQHFAPGTIVNLQVDQAHPLGFGLPAETFGFYNNSPFFTLTEGFASQRASVVARYPNTGVLASGWLRGEDLMAGRAAVVAVEMNPGRIILFGLRPQHRAQTHATFPLLFNAFYWAASQNGTAQ